jgi:hypothetical protein
VVVELEVPVQPVIGVIQRVIAVGVHLFILDRELEESARGYGGADLRRP